MRLCYNENMGLNLRLSLNFFRRCKILNLVNNLKYLSDHRGEIPHETWGKLASNLIDCYNERRRTADFQRAEHIIKQLNDFFKNVNLPLVTNFDDEFKAFISHIFCRDLKVLFLAA